MSLPTAKELSRLTGAEVQNHPYDRGYWAGIVGEPEPSDPPKAREGWQQADRELLAEATA